MSKITILNDKPVIPGSKDAETVKSAYRNVEQEMRECSMIAVINMAVSAEYARNAMMGKLPWDNLGASAPMEIMTFREEWVFSKPVALETPERLYLGVASAKFKKQDRRSSVEKPSLTIEFFLRDDDSIEPIERALQQNVRCIDYERNEMN